jgi:hypothetical protein
MLAAVGLFEFAILVALFIGFFGGVALAILIFLRITRGKGSKSGREKE